MEQDQRKKKKNPIVWIAACFFALVFGFSGIMLARELIRVKKEEDAFIVLSASRPRREGRISASKDGTQPGTADTVAMTKEDGSTEILPTATDPASAETEESGADGSAILEENQRLYEINPDFFAWITIPGTNIDYPVMYAPRQKDFYLNHDFYKNEALTGVPYLDERCDPDGSYYLVYGHRPKLGTMFYQLVDFQEESFWQTHREVYFDTLNEERTYVVAAAFKARALNQNETEGFRYYNYKSLDTEEKFSEYMEQVGEAQLYDTGIDISFGDEILVLSTCYRDIQDGRFVVVAKRMY